MAYSSVSEVKSVASMVGLALRLPALCVSFVVLVYGLCVYLVIKRTPSTSYYAMRRLYGPTNGRINRALLRIMRWCRPAARVESIDGFLGTLSELEIAAIAAGVEKEGFAMLPRTVSRDLCESLTEFARTTPCMAMGYEDASVYSEENPRALRLDFPEQAILTNSAACRIIFDGSLAAIATAYFKCQPIYDFCAMWWTTRAGEKDYSRAAQKFHFDLDRPFFLKFFIYLTDVTALTGPHVYVSGSHRAKPRLLGDPRRFEDSEVESCYPPEAINVICGKQGSIFAVDTSGIHKGLPVVSGDRLVFQIEFAINRFGQNYAKALVVEDALRDSGVPLPLDREIFGSVL